MARRRTFGFSFSWRRALGVSAAKGRFARATGVPTTRGGRQRKAGRLAGCGVVLALAAGAGVALAWWAVGARILTSY